MFQFIDARVNLDHVSCIRLELESPSPISQTAAAIRCYTATPTIFVVIALGSCTYYHCHQSVDKVKGGAALDFHAPPLSSSSAKGLQRTLGNINS